MAQRIPHTRISASLSGSLRLGLALRLAWKGLVRSPGNTLLATAVLTLGLAAPTTFFSLLVGAIRPLPVPQGDKVIRVEVVQPSQGGRVLPVTLEDLRSLRGGQSLEALGGFRLFQGTLVDPGQAAARVSGAALTSDVLPLLRISPALGRVPSAHEREGTLLLGHELWVEAFGGDPGVLGRVVTLDGVSRIIVGILPQDFGFPFHQNAWTILEEGGEDGGAVELVGRLGQDTEMASAQSELSGLWARRDPVRAAEDTGGALAVDGFTGGRGERGEGIAFLGLVMVALALLLIACSNVANLLLVRATERVRSLAVQAAVGASRLQIGVQLFLEALLVALVGGLGGLFVAWLAVGAIEKALASEHFGYYWMAMAIDGRVLLFTSLLVLGTALISGLLPVLRVTRADLQGVLKEETAGMAVGGGGAWSRAFVTAQLALSCGALVAAGISGVSMLRGSAFGETLPSRQTVLASLSLDPGSREAEIPELEGAFSSLPGVEAVAISLGAPGFMEPWGSVEVEGEGAQRPQDRQGVLWNGVTPGFFRVFGLEARQGRLLSEGDHSGSPPAAVVNESFVRRSLPSGDPLGRRVRIASADTAAWFTVVGVVEDLEVGGGPRQVRDRVYLSLSQLGSTEVMAVVRAAGDPMELVPELRRAAARVDPRMPLWSARTLADAYAYLIRVPRSMGAMAFGGGVAGLLVAAVGLYGLLSFRVRQRRRELGLRLALGADGSRLARDVLSMALRQLLPAAALGLLLAWIAAPLMAVALLGGDPRSPVVYVGVAGSFLAVGLAAALAPALRAGALEPARALRGE